MEDIKTNLPHQPKNHFLHYHMKFDYYPNYYLQIRFTQLSLPSHLIPTQFLQIHLQLKLDFNSNFKSFPNQSIILIKYYHFLILKHFKVKQRNLYMNLPMAK